MARSPTRVLPFVVPEKSPLHQSSLLAQWEVLNLHLTHELLRVQRLGPLMLSDEVLQLAGEWALLAQRLDAIELAITSRTAAHAQAVGLIA